MEFDGANAQFGLAIAAFLKRTRERSGISQETLATQMRRDQPWVSKTEHGARRVQISELLAWLDAVGSSIAEAATELDQLWIESHR